MSGEAQPVPPENVRVVFDGTDKVVPLECVYLGRNPVCGCHVWRNPVPVYLDKADISARPRLRIGFLPAGTEVDLLWEMGAS